VFKVDLSQRTGPVHHGANVDGAPAALRDRAG
jgi:hypothetical protein